MGARASAILGVLVGLALPLTAVTAQAADTVIHAFSDAPDSFAPAAGLISDASGAFYGTTAYGGTGNCKASVSISDPVIGCGTVYRLTPPAPGQTAWTKTTLYSFQNLQDGNGSGRLLLDAGGALYGLSSGTVPSTPTNGSIYKLTPSADPNAPWIKQTLYVFPPCTGPGSCMGGFFPSGGLVQGADGSLYGVTQGSWGNGTSLKGVVFKLTPPAPGQSNWTQTAIYNFCSQPKCADGRHPVGGLLMDANGALYGTTANGGNGNDKGTVFKLTPPATAGGSWTLATLYRFCGTMGCPDGQAPVADLVQGADGTLYGIASGGGIKKRGTIFGLTPAAGGTWTYNVLHAFCTAKSCGDGGNLTNTSSQGLILDAAGALYGVAPYGGASKAGCAGAGQVAPAKQKCGTAFKLTPPAASGGNWNLTTLHNFGLNPADGHWPTGTLAFGTDGKLYGTAPFGGNGGACAKPTPGGGCGVVFSVP